MIRIIETEANYEAGVALMRSTLVEMKKGISYSSEDIEYMLSLIDALKEENLKIHQQVYAFESRRYGGNKALFCELEELLATEREKALKREKFEKEGFDNMSREELLEYIKTNMSVGGTPEKREEPEFRIKEDEAEKDKDDAVENKND